MKELGEKSWGFERGLDILKACRSTPMTRQELERELGFSYKYIERYTDLLVRNGFLVRGLREIKQPKGGLPFAFEYEVAPAWKGQA